jgi:hypothetical protein
VAELLDLGAEEVVGDLGQHARAVAGLGVGVHGAAVGQGAHAADGAPQDLFRPLPVDAGDETDAAGVVLGGGIIEARRDALLGAALVADPVDDGLI